MGRANELQQKTHGQSQKFDDVHKCLDQTKVMQHVSGMAKGPKPGFTDATRRALPRHDTSSPVDFGQAQHGRDSAHISGPAMYVL